MAVHPPEGAAVARGGRPRRPPAAAAWLRAPLRLPLLAKIVGANAVVVLAATGVALLAGSGALADRGMVLLVGGAFVLALVATLLLVRLALRPLAELQATAERVWRGDLDARVPRSAVADRDMARLGTTLNLLLDGLAAERERLRHLASEVIRVGDDERARIAHELHDSTAQALAALTLQLGATARDSADPDAAARLAALRELAAGVMEEVRLLAHTVHPRVLDDLGLAAALHTLAREAGGRNGVTVDVAADGVERLPPDVAAALYRVAQEALRNALRHAAPRAVAIRSAVVDGVARLEVADDGAGFDVAEAERRRPGMGLFAMRERVALLGGTLDVASRAGEGARVVAQVPLAVRPLRGHALDRSSRAAAAATPSGGPDAR